jgi:hypothetical protein
MRGALVSDLGLAPEIWLFLSLLGCVTLFFKFSRFWSIRNLDLLLLFVLVPGMMLIVGDQTNPPWSAFIWLFLGSGLWLLRCLLDLGLARRPVLEPNLSASGLLCLSIGVLGLPLAILMMFRPTMTPRRPLAMPLQTATSRVSPSHSSG